MAQNKLNIHNLLTRKLLFFTFLSILLSFNTAFSLRYNRGPLELDHPSNTNTDKIVEDEGHGEQFTGATYVDHKEDLNENNEKSMLEVQDSNLDSDSEDVEDENEDDDQEEEEEEEFDNEVDEPDNKDEDYYDRAVDSSLAEVGSELSEGSYDGESEGAGRSDDEIMNPKNLKDNKLKEYLQKVGALDKMRSAKNKGKQAMSSIKSKINKIPETYGKIKGKIYSRNNKYDPSAYQNSESKVNHGRRLLNTMNEVDERRRNRQNGVEEGTHSTGGERNKVNHGRRLFDTMNDVDEKRKKREGSRFAAIKRRFRNNDEYEG